MQRKLSDQDMNDVSNGAKPRSELAVRGLFLVVYLAADIGYVLASVSFYEATVIAIQGKGFPSGRVADALAAYALLAVGWFLIAAPSVQLWADKGYRPVTAGASAGFIYGLVLYGVYNTTLRAQFENYSLHIALRDMTWGSLSAAFVTMLYSHVAFSRP
jgi:uncharacterized membrane protein